MKRIHYMQRCLELAALGAGKVAPNPLVGAVIVHNNRIIGEGYHQVYGGPHAEVEAVNAVKDADKQLLSKATLFVNLEPCAHHGKTPPCADLIIAAQIPHVVIANVDTYPEVDGQGIDRLRRNGVEVETGLLEKEGRWLNRRFFCNIEKKRPYVLLKWAQSGDGYLGRKSQKTKISNSFSDRLVHKWRNEEAAILVGTKTAMIDDPALTTRYAFENNPLRIILDRAGKLPNSLQIMDNSTPTWIITEKPPKTEGQLAYIQLKFDDDLLKNLLEVLQLRNIQSLMVEGGAFTLQKFIDQELWDEARIITSNTFLKDGVPAPAIRGTAIHSYDLYQDNIAIYTP